MGKDIIKKYPRLVFMAAGMICVIFSSLITGRVYDSVIEEHREFNKSVISRQEKTMSTQRETINSLRVENKSLKTRSSTYKIVKPDGTIIERTNDSSESESSISESVKSEYEKQMKSEVKAIEERLSSIQSSIKSSNKKLHLRVGGNTSLQYEIGGDYNIKGPFTIGAGMVPQSNTYSLSIGISL